MTTKIIKIFAAIFLIIVVFLSFIIYNLFSNYKKLESAALVNDFVTDTIPFTFSNSGHILIDVKLGGNEKSYPFILDSGASNMIFSNHIDEFGFEQSGRGFGIGSGGDYFFTKIKKIDQLQIDDLKLRNLYAEEVDFDFDCMEHIYGIIGTGVMHHFDWQIDFKNKRIIIAQKLENLSIGKNKIVIPLSENRFSHHLKTSIAIPNGKNSIEILVDLGNNGTLSFPQNKMPLQSNFLSHRIYGRAAEGLGDENNEISTSRFYLLDSLAFSSAKDFQIKNLPVLTTKNGLNLLGLGFLKNYKTTLSWSEKKLILEPYHQNPDFIWKTDGFAMNFNEETGKVIIVSIIEGSPAATENLPLHAEVLSLNDVIFSDKNSYCSAQYLQKVKDTLNLEVKENGIIKEYFIIKEPIFDSNSNQ